eukprot:TRINITY_DN12207_c0_g1_i1.p1 TRINITY_DN12207_c0_g1~~TRINITY_DN12207_c0_g1_i1.p1  ORF type:complete len:296 (+),score=61.23 TRINITY_DN12207_c0_g1_i1:432-1319(+)
MRATLGSPFLVNVSQMHALYVLVLFYMSLHTTLAFYKPGAKFLCIKVVVFVTFWQSVVISGLVYIGTIRRSQTYTVEGVAHSLQAFAICIEMFFAAIAHRIAYPAGEYSTLPSDHKFQELDTKMKFRKIFGVEDAMRVASSLKRGSPAARAALSGRNMPPPPAAGIPDPEFVDADADADPDAGPSDALAPLFLAERRPPREKDPLPKETSEPSKSTSQSLAFSPADFSALSPDQVAEWMSGIGLSAAAQSLAEARRLGGPQLLRMSQDDVLAVFGLDDATRLLAALPPPRTQRTN